MMQLQRRWLWTVCGWLCWIASAGAAGELVAVPGTRDVGEVAAGKRLDIEFRLVNEGDQAIRFRRVRSTCSDCLSGTLAEDTLAAGASCTLKAVLDTDWLIGPVHKQLFVEVDGRDSPAAVLSVKAYVTSVYALLPRQHIDVSVRRGRPRQVWRWVLALTGGGVFAVTDVKAPEGVSVQVPLGHRLRDHALVVWVDETLPVGVVDGHVVLTTDSAAVPTVRIPLRVHVTAPEAQ